jgi:hypothetical protein
MSDDATPQAEPAPVQEPAQETKAATERRLSNRNWMLIVAAALVFGCFAGAGTMAVAGFVANHVFHGRDRAYVDHDRRGDERRKPQPPIRKQPAQPGQPRVPGLPKLPPTPVPSASS